LGTLHNRLKVVCTFFNVKSSSIPLTPALSQKSDEKKIPLLGERDRVRKTISFLDGNL